MKRCQQLLNSTIFQSLLESETNQHHLGDLPNSVALPTAGQAATGLQNWGDPLDGAGLFDSISK
jgi:hypothetical protein